MNTSRVSTPVLPKHAPLDNPLETPLLLLIAPASIQPRHPAPPLRTGVFGRLPADGLADFREGEVAVIVVLTGVFLPGFPISVSLHEAFGALGSPKP